MLKTRKVHVNDEVMSTAGVPVEDFDITEAFYQAEGSLELVLRDGNGEGSVVRVYEPFANELMTPDSKMSSGLLVARTLPAAEGPAEPRYVGWNEYVEQCGEGTKCVPRDVYSEAVYHLEELGLKDDIDRYGDTIDKLASAANGKFDARLYATCELMGQGLQDRLNSLGVDIYSTPAKDAFAMAYQRMVENGLYRDMLDVSTCHDMLKDVRGRQGAAQLADVAEVSDAKADKRIVDVERYKGALDEYVDAMGSYIETVSPESLSLPRIRDDVLYDVAHVMAGVDGYEPKWGVDAKRLASSDDLREAAGYVRVWKSSYEKRMAKRKTLKVSVSVTNDYDDDVETILSDEVDF